MRRTLSSAEECILRPAGLPAPQFLSPHAPPTISHPPPPQHRTRRCPASVSRGDPHLIGAVRSRLADAHRAAALSLRHHVLPCGSVFGLEFHFSIARLSAGRRLSTFLLVAGVSVGACGVGRTGPAVVDLGDGAEGLRFGRAADTRMGSEERSFGAEGGGTGFLPWRAVPQWQCWRAAGVSRRGTVRLLQVLVGGPMLLGGMTARDDLSSLE
ncbi:hypothetical protein C8F04DRAFT_554568 [Mycena alexandri]|uniref:Uncharacterized protein n=1 Tax=Mycena alexandri TaxID=1745969 RepID=A0AAD6SXV6_9AGAR|nr:hypothetical protein C8F04DRAFT_554568 [Mycena alexandri]